MQHISKTIYTNILFPFILIATSFIVYANILHNGIIWDDFFILDQGSIKSLSLANLIKFFTDKDVYHVPGEIYRPIYLISFALDYAVYGSSHWGYHLTNIFLHAITSILVWHTIYLIINNEGLNSNTYNINTNSPASKYSENIRHITSLAAAITFAVHPIHTESVAWIKGRDDIIGCVFLLLSLILYIKTIKDEKTIISYFSSLFFFILALLSKEMTATLPLLLILFNLCFLPKNKIKKIDIWLYLIPYFFLLALYMTARAEVLGTLAQSKRYWAGSFMPTIFTMAKGVTLYIKLLIFPINLCGDYLTFPIFKKITPEVLLSFSLIFGLMITAIVFYKYSRIVTFSISWFLISLLPVSNIIPINGIIAERFLYIPSIGFILLIAVVLKKILQTGLSKKKRLTILISFLTLTTSYAYGTINRNKVWENGFTFWGDVIKKYPSSRAYNNYGLAYKEKGDLENAEYFYKKALTLDPMYRPYALNNLAIVYIDKGLFDQAAKVLERATRMHKNNPTIHTNLGYVYNKKGFLKKAISEYQTALRLEPGLKDARKSLEKILRKIDSIRNTKKQNSGYSR